jgi:N-acetylmuramoyl-L-alanine amidase
MDVVGEDPEGVNTSAATLSCKPCHGRGAGALRRLWLAAAGLCAMAAVLLVGPAAALAQPEVSAVRLGVHPDKTRFVMEISEAAPYRVFKLDDPYRLVIDLPQIDWRIPESRMGAAEVGVVRALRFGQFSPKTSRVVLDLGAPVKVAQVFRIAPRDGKPHRLVVDIVQTSRAAFLASKDRQVTSSAPLPQAEPRSPEAPGTGGNGRPTVVIDAGHGGVDPGAIGVSGTYEKDLVLSYARHLAERLRATGKYRVVMTRDRDVFLRLRDRVRLAQDAGGDLFISMHANTHSSQRIRGASVYTLSETSSDKEAAQLAAKENKADLIAGVDLNGQNEVVSQILIDLAQRETMNASKHFANILVGELGDRVKLLKNTHRFAGFAVLKSPNVPSVLVEIGYMTNRTEEQQLKSSGHREKVNRAVVEAVDNFFAWREARNRT